MDVQPEPAPEEQDLKAEARRRVAPVIDRLLEERVRVTRITLLLDLLARELVKTGLPLDRMSLHIPQLHPQLLALTLYWEREAGGAVEIGREHGMQHTPFFQLSPVSILYSGGEAIRRRLDGPEAALDFPILEDLKAQGYRDYTVRPLRFSTGRTNAISFATRQEGGFTALDMAVMDAALPAFGAVLELRDTRRTAGVLLDTYVGPDTGGRILGGAIKRGDAEVMHAVLWYCDLRDFTELSGRLPLDRVIALLNDYFDCMARPVEARGGEILKFIGDAMLAIFPCAAEAADLARAAGEALAAAEEATAAMAALNEARQEAPLRCGIALHVGEVMYGNIGSAKRLDFTVIGPAVNLVSRLEPLSAGLERPIVVSATLAGVAERPFRPLGRQRLKGIEGEPEAFTLA